MFHTLRPDTRSAVGGAFAALVLTLSGCASAPPAPSSTAAADAATAGIAAAMAVTAASRPNSARQLRPPPRLRLPQREPRPFADDQRGERHARVVLNLTKMKGVDRNRARSVQRAPSCSRSAGVASASRASMA